MSSLCQTNMYSPSVWFTVLKFHYKRVKQSYPKMMKYNNLTASTDKEKADLFVDYFRNEIYVKASNTLPFHDQVKTEAQPDGKKSL